MNDSRAEPADPSVRFDRMERLLQLYPDISEDDLRELKRWITKDASSFEVASLASKESIGPSYRKFRAGHIDKFSVVEWIMVGIAVFIVLAVILLNL